MRVMKRGSGAGRLKTLTGVGGDSGIAENMSRGVRRICATAYVGRCIVVIGAVKYGCGGARDQIKLP